MRGKIPQKIIMVKMKSAYIYILNSKFCMVKLGLIKLQQ